jgi:CubicO group peptidase (beta-lactamase class C family)
VIAASELQARLAHLQGHARLPSVVAGVLDHGSLAWVGAAGDVPGDPGDTQYRIGSITKTLVAVLVLRARDEGLLGLDDPVGRFVPESGYADATVRSLLAHTSGMQSEPVGPWWERSPGVPVPDLLTGNDGSARVAAAGEYYHYSNLGFALLGEAVSRLRGAGWWDCVTAELLEPLGMDRTTYLPTAPHAQGHSVEHFTGILADEPHQDTGAMAPAGQAWSTVTDLARWADFLATGHPDVLSRATLDEMATAQPPAPGYGLGLRLIELDGKSLRGHTGSMPGFLASLFVDPGTRDGAVLLTNATTGVGMDGVPQMLLGDAAPDPVEPWTPSQDLPDQLAGVPGLWFWGNSAYELRWHNGRVHLHELGDPADRYVFELRGDRIVGVEGYHRGETLQVFRDGDGRVHHLECATFVYTRVPYDPDVDIPGGHPRHAATSTPV